MIPRINNIANIRYFHRKLFFSTTHIEKNKNEDIKTTDGEH